MPKTDAAVLSDILTGFKTLLDTPSVTEGAVQDYMEQHSELIPLPLLLGHDLHMDSVISKFELDRCRVPDFAYLTKNTSHWRLVAIELERPEKSIFTQAERAKFTAETDEALAQIQDWKLHVAKHIEDIRRRLSPLLRPYHFRDNIIDVQYALIIGRGPHVPYTEEQKGRLFHLQKENSITFMTYDSIIRMAEQGHQRIGYPKNILVHNRNGYRMKYAAVKYTHQFAWYGPDVLELSSDQIQWYKDLGYDMDAWLRGEPLCINCKYPASREKEAMAEVRAAIEKNKTITATPPGTFAPPAAGS
jgi:hypothetical protein